MIWDGVCTALGLVAGLTHTYLPAQVTALYAVYGRRTEVVEKEEIEVGGGELSVSCPSTCKGS